MNDLRQAKHFFGNVMVRLGHYGWKIRFVPGSREGYCWTKTRTIDVGEDARDIKRLILHEIAHIGTARWCNNKHNITFWRQYNYLLRRFLQKKFDYKDLLYMKDVGHIGYYKLCYG